MLSNTSCSTDYAYLGDGDNDSFETAVSNLYHGFSFCVIEIPTESLSSEDSTAPIVSKVCSDDLLSLDEKSVGEFEEAVEVVMVEDRGDNDDDDDDDDDFSFITENGMEDNTKDTPFTAITTKTIRRILSTALSSQSLLSLATTTTARKNELTEKEEQKSTLKKVILKGSSKNMSKGVRKESSQSLANMETWNKEPMLKGVVSSQSLASLETLYLKARTEDDEPDVICTTPDCLSCSSSESMQLLETTTVVNHTTIPYERDNTTYSSFMIPLHYKSKFQSIPIKSTFYDMHQFRGLFGKSRHSQKL